MPRLSLVVVVGDSPHIQCEASIMPDRGLALRSFRIHMLAGV